MSSTPASGSETPRADLTAEARIRGAALELFARSGHASVTVRAVAEAADVSPALVIHHFGSKAGLITAVDNQVMERISHHLDDMAAQTDADGAKAAMVALTREPALFDYLGRSLAEGGPVGDHLYDRLYQVTLDLLALMTDAGVVQPIEDRPALATLLLANDMAMILLRRHIQRTLGVDPSSPEGLERLAAVDLHFKTNPLLVYPPEGGPS